jgi:hypothetical protein
VDEPEAGSLQQGPRIQVKEKPRQLRKGQISKTREGVEIEAFFIEIERCEGQELTCLFVEIRLEKEGSEEAGEKDFKGGESSLVLKG